MIAMGVTVAVMSVIVWIVTYYHWTKLLAGITLLILATISAFLYFANITDEISPQLKCDRMHGVLITEQNEQSCVDRDSIKKIDLDKVFDN